MDAISLKLKSGKSTATNTSGRSARAASTRRRIIAYDRGMTRSASVKPVTESPAKSPINLAPDAPSRRPPNPNTSSSGTRVRSASTKLAAYRSPDGSPHEIITRIGSRLSRALELARGDGSVERHLRQCSPDRRTAGTRQLRVEGYPDAIHRSVVGEHLFGCCRTPVLIGH